MRRNGLGGVVAVGILASTWLGNAACGTPIGGDDERPAAVASGGMVATVSAQATEAGLAAFKNGGNAIDAAVAAALTLGVVDGYNSGIGGGTLILIRTPGGQFHAIDARERAPAAAHRTMYVRNGKADATLSQDGPLAVATPGALAGYERAVADFGRLPLADLILPAAELAERGFEVSPSMAARLREEAPILARYVGSLGGLLHADGAPLQVGQTLVQRDLAATYRHIAEEGSRWFYRGEFAQRCHAWFAEHGGILTAQDLADYEVRIRPPLVTDYRGYTIVGFPPPSSGGVHVAQILNILEAFDLRRMHEQDPAAMAHVVAEAMKLAFADRGAVLGRQRFRRSPAGTGGSTLRGPTRGADRRGTGDRGVGSGRPALLDPRVFEKHTTHVAAADAEGYWVALTTTVNTSFGSKVVVPGTGVVLNNQMDDFSIAPGQPNAYGLVGADANAVEPGKRPLSSMSPTIVLRDGQPILTVGAAGGPRIITQVVWAIICHVDLGWPLDQSIAQPRLHHQWIPDTLYCERGLSQDVRDGLTRLGHQLQIQASSGVSQAIAWDAEQQRFLGVADPRAQGSAQGFDTPMKGNER